MAGFQNTPVEGICKTAVSIYGDNILQEAHEIVNGDRAAAYGEPYDDFNCVAKMFNAYLEKKYEGQSLRIDATDVPIFQICVKIAREAQKHKRDNLVDIAGYAETLRKVLFTLEIRGEL